MITINRVEELRNAGYAYHATSQCQKGENCIFLCTQTNDKNCARIIAHEMIHHVLSVENELDGSDVFDSIKRLINDVDSDGTWLPF